DGIAGLPAPMEVKLTPRAGEYSWFQRIVRWENQPLSPYPVIRAHPSDLVAPVHPIPAGPSMHADMIAGGLAADGRGFRGRATAYVAQSRLLHFATEDVPAGAVLRATGVLKRGGLQIGILQDDAWLD